MKLRYGLLFGLVALGAGLVLIYRRMQSRRHVNAGEYTPAKSAIETTPETEAPADLTQVQTIELISLFAATRADDETPPGEGPDEAIGAGQAADSLPGPKAEQPATEALTPQIDNDRALEEDAVPHSSSKGIEEFTAESQPGSSPAISTGGGDQTAEGIQPITQQSEAEATPPKPVQASPAHGHGTVEPVKHGGGRTADAGIKQTVKRKVPHQRDRKPELICFESAREWVLAVELPEMSETDEAQVSQQDNLLQQDERNERCWRLRQAFGVVQVQYSEGQSFTIDLGNQGSNHLLFKLSGEDHKRGRRVQTASSGAYLLVAPEHWTRTGVDIGLPEPVSVIGYKAHYFVLDAERREPVAFQPGTGQLFALSCSETEFELVGESKVETCDDLGPLFTGELPQIRARSVEQWQHVKTIIIGHEGRGRAKWREEFKPVGRERDQPLPDDVRATTGGWYFLRFYDWDDELSESLDFRYLRDLWRIRVDPICPVPGEEGHKPVIITFEHLSGCSIEAANPDNKLYLERYDKWSIARIPARPSFDQTRWAVPVTPLQKVKFSLLLERVWWAVDDRDDAGRQPDWIDKALEVEKKDFLPTSSKTLRVWFPKPGWIGEVYVGCSNMRRRRFTVSSASRSISVPLRDFSDSPELSDSAGVLEFRLWISRGGSEFETILLHTMPHAEQAITHPEPAVAPVKPAKRRIPDRLLANCSNCDHAKTRRGIVRCTRHHWSLVFYDVFLERHGRENCSEWVGEFVDEQGGWTSDAD